MNLNEFEKIMKNVSDEKFNETISKGALQLEDDQIKATSFVFWLVYMAESDLNDVIDGAWKLTQKHGTENKDVWEIVEGWVQEMLTGEKEYEDKLDEVVGELSEEKRKEIMGIVKDFYQKKRIPNIAQLDYFIDKIRVVEGLYGETERVKLFWKLNSLRNKISHNKIDELRYNDEDLKQRSVREKLLLDYFRTALETDFSKSESWNSLSDEQKAQIEEKVKEIKRENTDL